MTAATTVKYLILCNSPSHYELQMVDFKKPPNFELYIVVVFWVVRCFTITLSFDPPQIL